MRVDSRAGSKNLIQPLMEVGCKVEAEMLAAGDIEIIGNGPDGKPVFVGIEYKSIEDLAACCRNGRFAQQLRGMHEMFDVSWLLIEGRWRGTTKEGIEVKRGSKWFRLPGRVTSHEINSWLMTMTHCSGLLIWHAETIADSVMWLRGMELWWTAKEWEDHRAHLDWYMPPISANPFREPPLARKFGMLLPGVGDKKSDAVVKHFKSVRNMANATENDWVEIDGIGKKIAGSIVKSIVEEV